MEKNIKAKNNIEEEIVDTVVTGIINDEEMMNVEINPEVNVETKLTGNKNVKPEYRKVMVPANRLKSLKENWPTIVKALVEHMKIQVKMNIKMKCVEMRTCETTDETSALQKSEEFMKAFVVGFDLQDAIAMLRLEDLYLETFEIKDGN